MSNAIMIGTIFMVTSVLFAVPRPTQTPEVVSDVQNPISANAGKVNHAALVNVGGAVCMKDWALSANFAATCVDFNVWTNSIDGPVFSSLIATANGTAAVRRLLGPKACIGVFVVNDPNMPPFMSVPRAWCIVNIAELAADKPDKRTYRDRLCKVMLKGLVYAGGAGSTFTTFCSLYWDTATLEKLDEVKICISPMAYLPLSETLDQIGGPEIGTKAK